MSDPSGRPDPPVDDVPADGSEGEVLLIDDLARLLKTSVRTIKRQLRAGTFFVPEMPNVDYRHRWSRTRVMKAIAETTLADHRAAIIKGRRKT
jgi:hypothetical protein